MTEYHWVYPSTHETVNRMLDQLLEVLEKHKVEVKLGNRITLALSEAFTNALIHGNKLDPNKQIDMVLKVNETEITADITDEGIGGLDEISSREPSTLLSENGRGVDLIRYCSSSTTFDEVSGGGLKISATFRREETESLHIR